MDFFTNIFRNFKVSSIKKTLHPESLPRHLGLILDGNRRFAKSIGVSRKEGHARGISKFREVLTWAYDLNIPVLTIWVFSSENWERDSEEVQDITDLFLSEATRHLESGELREQGIRFRAIGDYSKFPEELRIQLAKLEEDTKKCEKMVLNVSIGYGGRQEIVSAVNKWILENPGKAITEADLTQHSYLDGLPSPDYIIRTSGEQRHSGFLLWHSSYAEYYFSSVFWPALQEVDFLEAMKEYQLRSRRFGK